MNDRLVGRGATALAFVTLGAVALVASCGKDKEEPEPPPPLVTETGDLSIITNLDTSVLYTFDTAPPTTPNNDPSNFLFMDQSGRWDMSPAGGPYTALSGTLSIREYIDALDTTDSGGGFTCEVDYALTGTPDTMGNTCPNCDFVFVVDHVVTLGNPGNCADPDTPADGAQWLMGFSSAGTGNIYLNYQGTGVWIPWYEAAQNGDSVFFRWDETVAIFVPEDTTTQ